MMIKKKNVKKNLMKLSETIVLLQVHVFSQMVVIVILI
uniref:Uncharacterized protein n=1 Tax=Strongyloides papillosus TaxID=174720 RepID=A0A0N5CIX1_STREA